MLADAIKVFIPAVISFIIGILITPALSGFLYKKQAWKKQAKTVAIDGSGTPIFNSLHKDRETKVPRMGGILIWVSVLATTFLVYFADIITKSAFFDNINFFTRSQTWIPLASLLIGAIVGLFDDYLEIKGTGTYIAGGLSLKKRMIIVSLIGLLVSLWFYFKLDVNTISPLTVLNEIPVAKLTAEK